MSISYPAAPASPDGYWQPQPRNGPGVAAILCGIPSLIMWLVPYLGLALSLVAVIKGWQGKSLVREGKATNLGVSWTGLVCGLLSVAPAGLWTFAWTVVLFT